MCIGLFPSCNNKISSYNITASNGPNYAFGISTPWSESLRHLRNIVLHRHIRTKSYEVIKKQFVIDEQLKKIGNLEEALQSKDDTLHELEGTCETARSIDIKLSKVLCDVKVKHAEEVQKIKNYSQF